MHHLEATQSSESDERARVEWCGKEWTSFNYSRHDVVLPIDQPNCITRIVIENVVRFWNFRRLIFMINDAAHCPSLVALADGIIATNRLHCIARDDVIPGTLKFVSVCVCVCVWCVLVRAVRARVIVVDGFVVLRPQGSRCRVWSGCRRR